MIFVRSFALGTIQSFYLQWQNHSIRKSKCNRGKRILKLLVKERNIGITLWGVLKSQVSWPNPRPALSTRNPEISWNLNVGDFRFLISQKVRSFHIIKCFGGCHFISNRVWLEVFRWTLFEQIWANINKGLLGYVKIYPLFKPYFKRQIWRSYFLTRFQKWTIHTLKA